MKKASLSLVLTSLLIGSSFGQTTTYIWDPSGTGTGSDLTTLTTWTTDPNTKEWANSGSDVSWPNGTNDIAQFGTTATAHNVYTVAIAGTVNAGGITLAGPSGSAYYLGSSGGTIQSAPGSTFVFANATNFFNDAKLGATLTGASTYNFTGSSVGQGNGTYFFGSGNIVGNVNFGTGSDFGEMAYAGGTVISGKTTINQGWGVYLYGGNNANYAQAMTLNGFGSWSSGGTLMFDGSTGQNLSGALNLTADSSIMGSTGGAGANVSNKITSTISGSSNLYLGFEGQGAGTGTQQLIVAGVGSTNSGATIIFDNNVGIAANFTVGSQAVSLGADNGLSTVTTLVLGLTGANTTTLGDGTVIASANSSNKGINWGTTNGQLDMAGHIQTVKGLVTGGTASVTGDLIYNSDVGTTSTLTVDGSTSLQAGTTGTSGFAGVLEDNTGTGGTLALALTGGELNLTGTSNTYSGGTTVTGGTLSVNNATSTTSATGTGNVGVSGGGILAGGAGGNSSTAGTTTKTSSASLSHFKATTGFVGATTAIGSGGVIAPGNSGIGTMTLANLTLSASSVADFEFDSTTAGTDATSQTNDFLNVTGALSLGSGLTFNLYNVGTTTAFDKVGVYDLIGYGSDSGFNLSDFVIGDAQSGFTYTFVDDTMDKVIQLEITASATPEPSTWAMLMGGFAVLAVLIRRRAFQT